MLAVVQVCGYLRKTERGSDEDSDGKVEANERVRESVEWLNALLRGVWPIINTNLFVNELILLLLLLIASHQIYFISGYVGGYHAVQCA